MICRPCKMAGKAVHQDQAVARAFHDYCPAVRTGNPVQCACQHLISTQALAARKDTE